MAGRSGKLQNLAQKRSKLSGLPIHDHLRRIATTCEARLSPRNKAKSARIRRPETSLSKVSVGRQVESKEQGVLSANNRSPGGRPCRSNGLFAGALKERSPTWMRVEMSGAGSVRGRNSTTRLGTCADRAARGAFPSVTGHQCLSRS